jgi:chemotaxis protein CheX
MIPSTPSTLSQPDLDHFVNSIVRYFRVSTTLEPAVTSAFLGSNDMLTHEFNGLVSFSGKFHGHVIVSATGALLRELLLIQHERDLSDSNLLDAVGEIANTLAGNARKNFGSELDISVPLKLQGRQGLTARTRSQPYVITLVWNKHPALVCVDLVKR